ncbi:MAG TPA: VWA domain-containing protein [Terriglobia bacterium]|nr:VWA domain-containing protein [Terriglobia bacterium]
MKRYRNDRTSRILVGIVVLIFGFPLSTARSMATPAQDQQPTPAQDQQAAPAPNGPATQPGETVLVPKKTQPSTGAQPAEKKPEKINPKEIYTVSTTTSLVNVDVLVTDRDGNPINALTKPNFRVYDDGVEQTVSNFGTVEAPLTVCLLVEFANQYWPFLYLALEDAYGFLGTMKPQDWVAAVEFDFKTHILTDFTQDRGTVRAALDTLRIPGFSESNLYDALAYTIDRMKDIQGRKAIIVICTGIDTFSKITYGDMLKIAKASDTPIYPMSTLEFMDVRNPRGGGLTPEEARIQLNYIAQYSGGQAYFPRFDAEIPQDYQQIAGQLRNQYSLGFIPTNPARDGKYHKLKVDLIDSDGSQLRIVNQKGKVVKYKVLARDGYYAPKS